MTQGISAIRIFCVHNSVSTNVSKINYIDEDWGQLDYYAANFPVKFPCVLIDINHGQYSNLAKDIKSNAFLVQSIE